MEIVKKIYEDTYKYEFKIMKNTHPPQEFMFRQRRRGICITVKKDGPKPRLIIEYFDNDLMDQGKKELQEMEVKETDRSML